MNIFNTFGKLFGIDGNTKSEDARARDAQDAALAAIGNIQSPNFSPINYDNMKWLEDFTPSTIGTPADVHYSDIDTSLSDNVQMGDTAFNDVAVDPRLKEAQLAALGSLQELGKGGLSLSDKATLNRIGNDSAQADKSRRDAIINNMNARGMGGSGMELLATLQSNQAATDRQSQMGMDVAGQAQDRALQALMQGGTLAGNIRGQDYSEQAAKAQAKDAIAKFNAANTLQNNQFNAGQTNNTNQFNASNQLDTNKFNTNTALDVAKTNMAAKNTAGMYNNQGRQDVANNNVGINNAQQLQNKFTAPQQKFSNDLAKGSALSGAETNKASAAIAQGDRKAATAAGQMDGLIKTGLGVGSLVMMSDKSSKKDIADIDEGEITAFLDSLKPKSFRYKDELNGQGDRTGVIAQDLEKSQLGRKSVVEDANGNKQVDVKNLLGTILASLDELNKRTK